MVIENSQEDEQRNPKGGTCSWGPARQFASTSGSVGSPSSNNNAGNGMTTPFSDNFVLRLNNLPIHNDGTTSQGAVVSKKKKRGQFSTGTDKNGHVLQQFRMKVCEKVESRGRTTYKEDKKVIRNSQEDEQRNPKGGTHSWGPAASGQSESTSGNVGSPSSHNKAGTGMITPFSDNFVLRLNNLAVHSDDTASKGAVVNKKKRGKCANGTDKNGHGLRQFSMKVCEKVESRGRTTYKEVADELVAEYAAANNGARANEQPGYDEKNIRRRVYDAMNVLMAIDIISKDKKEIQWKGLPRPSLNDIEQLKIERGGLRNKIEKKAAYLQELEEQFVGYQNLIQRNQRLYGNENAPTGSVALPFILVQSRPNATVEAEISEDMQLWHFDFDSIPFELHDDNYVLKQMKICDKPLFGGGASNASANADEDPSIPCSNHFEKIQPSPPKPFDSKSSEPPPSPKSYKPQTCTSLPPPNTYQPQMPLPPTQPNSSM